MYKCQYCGKEFNNNYGLAGHTSHCKLNPNYNKEEREKLQKKAAIAANLAKINKAKEIEATRKERKLICKKCGKEYILNLTDKEFDNEKYSKFCSRSCANSRQHSEETKNKISNSIKNQISLGNIVFYPQEHYTKCKYCGKDIIYIGSKKYKRYCSNECKKQYLSEHTGGYRKGSGIGKHGWYKGIYCDSTWELAFLIYYLDHNLFIQRCKENRKYIFENKEHTYIPDFVTDEGIIEIKGYKTKESEAKRLQNQDIKCLYKEDITKYIDYVKSKYKVNNIQDLYE